VITNVCKFVYLFICGLFNDAVSSSDYKTSNDRMINEKKRTRKEAVAASFEVLP
jgi:hypothetical protein